MPTDMPKNWANAIPQMSPAQTSANPMMETARTSLASAPDIGPLQGLKIGYAPSKEDARNYIAQITKDSPYTYAFRTRDDDSEIFNDISDIYIVPREVPADGATNEWVQSFGTPVTQGVLGTVATKIIPGAATAVGGIGGGIAGAGGGPGGVATGALLGAGGTAGAMEYGRQKIGQKLYHPDESFNPTWWNTGDALTLKPSMDAVVPQALMGAALEGVGRYALPVALKPFMGNKAEQIGEKVIGSKYVANPKTQNVSGQNVNLDKILYGTEEQVTAETAKSMNPLKAVFKDIYSKLPAKMEKIQQDALNHLKKNGWTDEDIENAIFADASHNAEGDLVLEPAVQKAAEIGIGKYKPFFDSLRTSKTYADMTDEQLYDLMHSDGFLLSGVKNLENRIMTPKKEGMGRTDLMQLGQDRLLKYWNLINAKKNILPEGADVPLKSGLEDLATATSRMKNIEQQNKMYKNEGSRAVYQAPRNYQERGAEMAGSMIANLSGPVLKQAGDYVRTPYARVYGGVSNANAERKRLSAAALEKNLRKEKK